MYIHILLKKKIQLHREKKQKRLLEVCADAGRSLKSISRIKKTNKYTQCIYTFNWDNKLLNICIFNRKFLSKKCI